jgi:hypothetical protein
MNASMPSELIWRLVRAFTNQDKEEIKRLNHIWFHQLKKTA